MVLCDKYSSTLNIMTLLICGKKNSERQMGGISFQKEMGEQHIKNKIYRVVLHSNKYYTATPPFYVFYLLPVVKVSSKMYFKKN